jgi:hypothetical protein
VGSHPENLGDFGETDRAGNKLVARRHSKVNLELPYGTAVAVDRTFGGH